jgi:hypothetical protein
MVAPGPGLAMRRPQREGKRQGLSGQRHNGSASRTSTLNIRHVIASCSCSQSSVISVASRAEMMSPSGCIQMWVVALCTVVVSST